MTENKSALYREAILEHSRHPQNQGRLPEPDARAAASNPLCGDELELMLALADGHIRDMRYLARGCSIVLASASLMTSSLLAPAVMDATAAGLPPERARALGEAFRAMMDGGREDLPHELASLNSLAAVRQRPSRIRCALLPWEALESCLAQGQ